MILLKVIIFVFLLLFALIFAYYNLQSVKVSLPGYSLEIPLFFIIFASFLLGFLIAYVLSEIKGFGWRRYGDKLRKGLVELWKGYPGRAEGELSRLLDREEVTPLYIKALSELGKTPSLYLQRYSQGIVETMLAENMFRHDRLRAKDLLEKALGKNWENLRARRLLRSLYFIDGEKEKALELQKNILSDSEKALKKEEKRVLASMIASIKGVEASEELEKLPPTPLSLAVLAGDQDSKRRKKYISKAFSEGMHNEVLLILMDRNNLTPETLEVVEENRDKIDVSVLSLLYMGVGRYEKLEELKESLPNPIRLVIDKGLEEGRECYRDLVSLLHMWECSSCGRWYSSFTPVCVNCLKWNRLKVKGGS